jgi:hypothetical protein
MTHVGHVQPIVTRWRRAATRLNITFAQYQEKRMQGLRWCTYHGRWEAGWLFKDEPGRERSYCIGAERVGSRLRAGVKVRPSMTRRPVQDYAERGPTLEEPHHAGHDCLVCADIRRALGRAPLQRDYRGLFGVIFEV